MNKHNYRANLSTCSGLLLAGAFSLLLWAVVLLVALGGGA